MLNCRLLTVDAFCYLCGCCCCLSVCTVVILLIFCAPKGRIFFKTAFLFPWIELPFSLNRWIRSPNLHFLKPLFCRAAQDPVLTNLGVIIYSLLKESGCRFVISVNIIILCNDFICAHWHLRWLGGVFQG